MGKTKPLFFFMMGEKGSFEKHLLQAIQINKTRLPLYAALTDNQSIRISNQLIFWEIIALPLAKITDWCARKYQSAGIPIVKEDIVSMDFTPEFKVCSSVPPLPLAQFVCQNGNSIKRRIYKAYKEKGFSGIIYITQEELNKFEKIQTYHCMLRHLLESILRIADLAPKHDAFTISKGMRSTRHLSWFMIWLHLIFLAITTKFDEWAAPIQAKGIPIIAQDVPVIQKSKFYN